MNYSFLNKNLDISVLLFVSDTQIIVLLKKFYMTCTGQMKQLKNQDFQGF